MSEYQFTTDWFNWAPPLWKMLKESLPDGETYGAADHGVRDFLEIGSYEGRSTIWTIENMMRDGDTITCIDTWEGGEEHDPNAMDSVWNRFVANTEVVREKFPKRYFQAAKGLSTDGLYDLGDSSQTFHFIYIDGSHIAKDVLTDACMAWPLLVKGGIMVFDDYLWGNPRDILHRPKPAIDAFTNIFAEELDVLHVGYQLAVKKK